jgi:hypothetical protein
MENQRLTPEQADKILALPIAEAVARMTELTPVAPEKLPEGIHPEQPSQLPEQEKLPPVPMEKTQNTICGMPCEYKVVDGEICAVVKKSEIDKKLYKEGTYVTFEQRVYGG